MFIQCYTIGEFGLRICSEHSEMDKLSAEKRSLIMSRIRPKGSAPEMFVRRVVFSMGFRYRLHLTTIPGKPDLAFIGRKKVIFVHGCFWHRHPGCNRASMPSTRQEFWRTKLD